MRLDAGHRSALENKIGGSVAKHRPERITEFRAHTRNAGCARLIIVGISSDGRFKELLIFSRPARRIP
jgi:hypothetical protein